jgi:hypothetical protein
VGGLDGAVIYDEAGDAYATIERFEEYVGLHTSIGIIDHNRIEASHYVGLSGTKEYGPSATTELARSWLAGQVQPAA